jgi:group I intron endonuclease
LIIYKITNDFNNKVYIGQTIYNDLKKRIKTYKSEIQFRDGTRPIIQEIRKHGIDHFTWEVLEKDINSQQELDEKEIAYIKEYKSLTSQNGYNADVGGRGQGPRSEETKKKIGDAQRGKLNHMYGKTGAKNATSKKVMELTTGKTYESACEAARDLGINFSHICATARGKRGSTKGYVFLYVDENGHLIIPNRMTKIKNPSLRKKLHNLYPNLF